MITEKDIERINELYRKRKAGQITVEEASEHEALRQEYIKSLRENLRSHIESVKIKNPDGSIIDVKQRHDEKYSDGKK